MKNDAIKKLAKDLENLRLEVKKIKNKNKFTKKSDWKKFRANINKGEKTYE